MRKRKRVEAEVMERDSEICSSVTAANGAHLIWRSEEVLLPFYTDVSVQVAMNTHHADTHHADTHHADTHHANTHGSLPELRLVLLGRKGTGKSSAGNTVLGYAGGFESGKPTEECVKMRADVENRRVTMVDTPGWEWYYPLNSTPKWVRRETLRSVTLCPPGPHGVLLVLRACASVTQAYIEEIEEHLAPLGEGVWEHTMVLFTRGDELGLISMEQQILTSGPALRKLLQKCGTRYHALDNRSRGDGTQVKELIRKLAEMVDGKEEGHEHFEVENTALLSLEEERKRRARETRRKQRQMEAQVQRRSIKAALTSDCVQGCELDAHQSFSKTPRHLHEVRLVLLGERETGKSSAGNTILGGSFFQAGVTEECALQQKEVALRLVTVVDTPGWEGGAAGVTTERVKREIVGSVVLCPPGPHALLLNLRVDTLVRAGHVREHLKLLGEGVWRHIILLFTHGDQLRVGVDIEQHIKSGGRDLQWLLEKCRGRYHILSSVEAGGRASGGTTQVMELLEKVEKMAAGNRCEAFSELVQEVRDLSRQRNEKFHQQLKDMSDKMLRQEAELKKMRDREVRSLRWLFDRRRKVKSSRQADVEREIEENGERRESDRSNENIDLEERMRWLTEDKEREVQDLSAENHRILTELRQTSREREEVLLRLELKERQSDELREGAEELQAKMLELQRTIAENEHERKQADREREEGWAREAERERREKAEWVEKVNSLKAEMEESKTFWDDVVLEAQGKERRMEGEIEKKIAELTEKEKELREKEEDVKAMKVQHGEEMAEKVKEIEKGRVQHKEVDRKLKEREEEFERVKRQHEDELRKVERERERDIRELRREFEREKEKTNIEERHLRQIEEKMLQREKEKETIQSRHRKEMEEKMQDREKEEEALKALVEEERARIKEVRSQLQREISRREREKEEEVEKVKQECVARINDLEKKREEEIKALIEEFERERETQLQEKEREMAEIGREYTAKMEEREKEKEMEEERVKVNHVKQMQEKERENTELRLEVEEVQERLQQKEEREREYERAMEERERETEQMRRRVEEFEGILRRKEEDMGETVLRQVEEAERRMRKKEGEMEEMRAKLLGDAEREAREREKEVERERCEAEVRWREEQREREEKREREMSRLIEAIDRKGEEMEQRDKEIDEVKKTSWRYLKEIDRLGETIQTQNSREAQMMERIEEREREMEELRQRERENKSEVAQLRQTIQQTRSELKELTEKMEEEMTSMIREYEGEIARRDDGAEMLAREKEELGREVEAKIRDYESRQEEDRERLSRYEGEVKSKEAQIQVLCEEKDLEVRELKQMIDKLERESERMKERERRLEEMKELQRENEEIGEEFLKRGRELGEREENLNRKEEEVRRKEEELEEKESKLEGRERECEKKERKLGREQEQREEREKSDESVEMKERELENLLRALESKQQELNLHGRELEREVKGLKHRGKGLEEKESQLRSEEQELLSWRGELQVRSERLDAEMRQLSDTGRNMAALQGELRAREEGLKVALERLKERERSLEEREEEWSKREQYHADNTTEEEKEVGKGRDLCDGRERGVGELNDKHQGPRADGGETRGRGRSSDRVLITDGEDQRVKPAASAINDLDYKIRKERKMREEKEGMTIEGGMVARDFSILSPSQGQGISKNKGSPGSDLKVLLLTETWSSRHPAGVSILGGEEVQTDGSSLRRRKVQIAGRRLIIAEPAGLRWRDGPDPTATSQRQDVLDGAAWEPHAVLLVVPAFLTFTRNCRRAMEEHVELLGEEVWGRALVLLTWGETLGESAQQHFLRNAELMAVVERCGGRFHVLTSKKNKHLTEGLLKKIEDVVDVNSVEK